MSADDDVKLEPIPIAGGLWALLVYDEEEPVRAAEQTLRRQGVSTRRVRTCSAVGSVLRESALPVLVLTDTDLPDGGWADVLQAIGAVLPSLPVVVVSRAVDIKLYLDVLESGAYDFILPPLNSADVAHIVRGVLLKARAAVLPGHSETRPGSQLRRS
jgi:DNA-binding NtrC family response regulator